MKQITLLALLLFSTLSFLFANPNDDLINPKTDILGLTSISETDAVNTDGKQLKIKLK